MQKLWWLNLVRGIVALIVGILILGWPNFAQSLFVNFMAVFWLVSGLMSLQWGFSMRRKKGLWLVAGTVGTVVGFAILLRFFYQHYIEPGLSVRILGVLALLVGLMNVLGGFRTTDMTHEQLSGRLVLGLFEIGLGLLLTILDALGPVSKLLAGGWAFIGGVVLILQAFQMRRAKLVRGENV